jgi:hypothetical protein
MIIIMRTIMTNNGLMAMNLPDKLWKPPTFRFPIMAKELGEDFGVSA